MKKINLIFSSAILLVSLVAIGDVYAQKMGPGGSLTPTIGEGGFDGGLSPDPIVITEGGGRRATSAMNVAATIGSTCSIQALDLAFGIYNPSSAASYHPMSLYLTCTKDTSVSFKMDGGKNSDGTDRYMLHTNGVDKLKYNIFSDFGSTLIPINTIYSTKIATGTQQGIISTASIPTNQNIPAGNYADIVVVSIEY